MKKTRNFIFILLGLAIIGFIVAANGLFETNQDGHYQVKQELWTGEMSVRSNAGTYWQGNGDVWDYKNVATVAFGSGEDTEGALPAIDVMFNEGSEATQSGLVRIELPTNKESRLLIKNKFADGYVHFLKNGILPVIRNAVRLSANLRSAQDAYTTVAVYQQHVADQLENGTYVTVSEIKMIMRATGEEEEVQVTTIVMDKNGRPLREPNSLQELGCTVLECVIQIPEFDPKVKESISNRKDEAMKTELSKQEAIRAKQEALTAEQQGLKNVAVAKYKKEVELVEATTKAREKFEVAEFVAKEALESKKAKIAEGQGTAEANRLIVAAGLTPQQRMEMDIKIADVVSKNMSAITFPEIMIFGGGSNGAGPLNPFDAVGLDSFRKIVKEMGSSE